MTKSTEVNDPMATYEAIDFTDVFSLIKTSREGVELSLFKYFENLSAFTLNDFSKYLHLSERTLQRYKKENRNLDPLQSEKLLQLLLVYQKGVDVMGSNAKFQQWLKTENLALGKIRPKDLLDNSFGISLLEDELIRIEHGVLA